MSNSDQNKSMSSSPDKVHKNQHSQGLPEDNPMEQGKGAQHISAIHSESQDIRNQMGDNTNSLKPSEMNQSHPPKVFQYDQKLIIQERETLEREKANQERVRAIQESERVNQERERANLERERWQEREKDLAYERYIENQEMTNIKLEREWALKEKERMGREIESMRSNMERLTKENEAAKIKISKRRATGEDDFRRDLGTQQFHEFQQDQFNQDPVPQDPFHRHPYLRRPRDPEGGGFNMGPTKTTLPRTITFNGKGKWSTYESQMDRFFRMHNVQNAEAQLYYLSTSLTGDASIYYERMANRLGFVNGKTKRSRSSGKDMGNRTSYSPGCWNLTPQNSSQERRSKNFKIDSIE